MKRAEQYQNVLLLQREINERLQGLNFERIKELILWLANSKEYQRLKNKENQLIMLDCFCSVWLEEKKQLETLGIHEDIFYGVSSLQDVEKKYLAIKYCALRVENEVPGDYCEQGIDDLIEWRVSGIALCKIVIIETWKRQQNIVRLAGLLKEKEQLFTAINLLQNGLKVYPKDKDMIMELADCWMLGQQWQQAYNCLSEIEKPDAATRELLHELAKVI